MKTILLYTPMAAAAVIGVFHFRRLSTSFKWIAAYMIYTFIQQVFAKWMGIVYTMNYPVFHVYSIISIFFISIIYSNLLANWRNGRAILWIGIALALFATFCSIHLVSIYRYPSVNMNLFGLFAVALSLFYFNYMMDNPSAKPLKKDGKFWFASGMLFFYVSSYGIWTTLNIIIRIERSLEGVTWIINLLNVVFYSVVSYSIILESRNPQNLNAKV